MCLPADQTQEEQCKKNTRSKPCIWLECVWLKCEIGQIGFSVSSSVYNVNSWVLNVHLQCYVVVPVIFAGVLK